MDGIASSSTASPPGNAHFSPPKITKRTSSKTALRDTYRNDASPPSTPKTPRRRAQKGKQPLKAHKEETLRDYRPNPRHSHGLSWSSTTRDSVVDNLLLSLDNLSGANLPGFGMGHNGTIPEDYERDRSLLAQGSSFQMSRPAQRARTHTYSSSLSSDYDRRGNISTPSSRYSDSPGYIGRRSNSSSNFGGHNRATGAPRPTRVNGIGRSSSETQRPLKSLQTNGIVGHGRHLSEESVLENYGYSAVLETNRLAWGGRSVSMDHIYSEPAPAASILDRGRPVPSVHSKFEGVNDENACPEPGIPAGPRKKLNPTATGPVYVNAAPPKASALRKITTQSDLRSASVPSPAIPPQIRDQAADFVRTSSMRGDPAIPSVPPTRNGAAPGPAVTTARRKDTQSPHRERPGFFKRVFGSSSRTNSASSDRSPSRQGLPDHAEVTIARPRPQTGVNSASLHPKSEPKPQLPNESAVTAHPPMALNKKSSSFFRRRKKSNTETMQPPPLPLVNNNLRIQTAQPSPSISSLRKVMDPYLSNEGAPATSAPLKKEQSLSRPTTGESAREDSADSLDIFHSGYTPPPDASLGKRDSVSRAPSTFRPSEDTSKGSPQSNKLKVKKRKPEEPKITSPLISPVATSFLQDTSSREPSTATIGEHFIPPAEPRVSPLEEAPPPESNFERATASNGRPSISRTSTGDRIIASRETSPIEPSADMRDFSGGSSIHPAFRVQDEDYVVTSRKASQERPESKKSQRLFLQPTASEERMTNDPEALSPIDASRDPSRAASFTSQMKSSTLHSPNSPSTRFHSATSLPLVQVDGNDAPPLPRQSIETPGTEVPPAFIDDDAEYRERARKIFGGDEEDITKMEAAAWLGERNTLSTRTLSAYLHLFDFSGKDLLSALRALCGKLMLKGETQQFDRIITALSARWCECNPKHGFKAQDVVHTVFYSLILLNTDLHLADIGEKMSRSAYVKNTVPTIRRVVMDAAPNAFDETVRPPPSASRPSLPWAESTPSVPTSPSFPPDTPQERTSFERELPKASKRLSIRPGVFRIDSDSWTPDSAGGIAATTLVNTPWTGTMRGWEFEIESMLKAFFGSIRNEPLPLLSIQADLQQASQSNLSVGNFGLKRSGSVVSKAPSDNLSNRSKPGFRTMTMGFRNRSRPKLYPASTVGSSRTSFDDGNSVWSPAQSSSWSQRSFGKTLTSTSVGSLGHHLSPMDREFKHSIGFANALSQAIIREEGGTIAADNESALDSLKGEVLEDESLALEGAPWAKEGLVKHKHHLEAPDRKAKERSWSECFAVISKGKLTLFLFNTDTKSRSLGRNKALKAGRAAGVAATKVGGGDWMENAEQLDFFVLRQTIASTLPPPGYSKARPHVWALSLPTGAVHLFQVGTPEIAAEWMSTANYWSARLSKEPLSGGVSNIEYGWSDQVINPALVERSESLASPPLSSLNRPAGHMHTPSNGTMPRPSMQSSLRGSFDIGGGSKARLPGDKVQLTDWHPPSQSMMASQLMEIDQLKALTTYVANVEGELEKHNELKHAIELAYSPRHANHNKAMSNWQRKSEYLLREIVKFRTYIDSLTAAQKAKEDLYTHRAELDLAKSGLPPLPKSPLEGYYTAEEFSPGLPPENMGLGNEMREPMRDVTPRASHVPA